MRNATRRRARLGVVTLLVVGSALRIWAVAWNDRLQGDVNLFALSARELAEAGTLRYPMKYEYSDAVAYCAPYSTASQHPPLFPFAAGILARGAGTDETFSALKLLSLAGGLTLLASVARRALSGTSAGALSTLAFVGLSPTLVDFSGNGSPYVWAAWLLLASTEVVRRTDRLGVRGGAWAGLLAGIAPQIHSALAAIPVGLVVVGWLDRRRLSPRAVASFFGAAGAAGVPYFAWNLFHFGRPLYSYSPHVLWTNLGVAQEGVWGDVVTWRWVDFDATEVVRRITVQVGLDALEMMRAIPLDGSVAALALAVLGGGVLLRRAPRRAGLCAVPILLYLALVLPLPYRDRFGVPILVLAYVAAGAAVDASRGIARRGAFGLVAITLAWMLTGYFEDPRTRYYEDDGARRDAHARMRPVAERFARLPSGPTLGFSTTLTNGIEGVYYHRHPLVRGRSHGPPREPSPGELARKLVRDFGVRYVWTDAFGRAEVEASFPAAREVVGNGAYFVFELPPEASDGGVCGPRSGPLSRATRSRAPT